MKLVGYPGPIALVFFSGIGCTPSAHHGAAGGIPDSASDFQPASSDFEGDPRAHDQEPPVRPPPVNALASQSASLPVRPGLASRSPPYRVRVVDPQTRDLPTFNHDGRRYVLGTVGERYALVLSNPTPQRVEAVISIDGLDAIDGTNADYVHKRGYILPAYGSATIEGFRTSLDQVATFRFSSVPDSYAGRLGQARDVGVIGVAFFPERAAVAVLPNPIMRAPRSDEPRNDEREAPGTSAPGEAPPPAGAPPRKAAAAPAPMSASGPSDLAQESSNPVASSGGGAEHERKGLGTEFGEARKSHVDQTMFERARVTSPSAVVVLRYDDRAGLIALGICPNPPVGADSDLCTRESADPFRANRFAVPPP